MLRAAAATVPVVETVATSGQGVERLASQPGEVVEGGGCLIGPGHGVIGGW